MQPYISEYYLGWLNTRLNIFALISRAIISKYIQYTISRNGLAMHRSRPNPHRARCVNSITLLAGVGSKMNCRRPNGRADITHIRRMMIIGGHCARGGCCCCFALHQSFWWVGDCSGTILRTPHMMMSVFECFCARGCARIVFIGNAQSRCIWCGLVCVCVRDWGLI